MAEYDDYLDQQMALGDAEQPDPNGLAVDRMIDQEFAGGGDINQAGGDYYSSDSSLPTPYVGTPRPASVQPYVSPSGQPAYPAASTPQYDPQGRLALPGV